MIQCDAAAITRKQMLQFGVAPDLPVAKLSKDQQATLNALNETLAGYTEK